jgi:hypothetical protein
VLNARPVELGTGVGVKLRQELELAQALREWHAARGDAPDAAAPPLPAP